MAKRYGLIFDLDGTLIDSEPLKAQALSETIACFGGKVPAELYKQVMGKSFEAVRDHFLQVSKISVDNEAFARKFQELYQTFIQNDLNLPALTSDFLFRLKKHDFKLALVSSAKSWMIGTILEKFSLEKLFDVVISAEDVMHHKPDPEAYLLCLSKLSLKPEDALVFEDSESGIQAATAAGIQVISIRHKFNILHDLSKSILEISSLSELPDPAGLERLISKNNRNKKR